MVRGKSIVSLAATLHLQRTPLCLLIAQVNSSPSWGELLFSWHSLERGAGMAGPAPCLLQSPFVMDFQISLHGEGSLLCLFSASKFPLLHKIAFLLHLSIMSTVSWGPARMDPCNSPQLAILVETVTDTWPVS